MLSPCSTPSATSSASPIYPYLGTVIVEEEITKEAFAKMGYLQRVNLKQENPDLYQSLVKKER